LKLRCRDCGCETPEELGFCLDCRKRLHPESRYDLTLDDYAYEPDRDAIEMIKATGVLPYLVKNLALGKLEKDLLSRLSREARIVAYPDAADALVRDCAISLCVDTLPIVLLIEAEQPNAFTFGSEQHPFLVLHSGALKLLTPHELTVLFSHELVHVKSGHMLYHTVAEILGGGIGFSASFLGVEIVSVPVRLALLSWHRESEVTADRGSLLVANDITVMKSFMTKLALWSSRGTVSHDQSDIEKDKVGMLESVSELFHTHPLYSKRFKLVRDFATSEQFRTARRKIETRLSSIRALIPVCRFCGMQKPVENVFCPSCGRCQT
jgi:Zn-dependent protease with chaperone function